MKKKPKKRAKGAVPYYGKSYVVPWRPEDVTRPVVAAKPRDPRLYVERWARMDAMTARAH